MLPPALEMTLREGFGGVSGVMVRLMSDGELVRLEERRDLDQSRPTTAAAAQLWGLSGGRLQRPAAPSVRLVTSVGSGSVPLILFGVHPAGPRADADHPIHPALP